MDPYPRRHGRPLRSSGGRPGAAQHLLAWSCGSIGVARRRNRRPGTGERVEGTMADQGRGNSRGFGLGVLATVWLVAGLSQTMRAGQDPVPDGGSGMQVLTQGPVHEAFAEPVV